MGRRRTRTSRWPEPRAHLSIPRHLRTARKPVQLTPWRTRQQQSAFSWYLSTKRIYDERVCSPAIEFELGRETVTFHQITSRCPRHNIGQDHGGSEPRALPLGPVSDRSTATRSLRAAIRQSAAAIIERSSVRRLGAGRSGERTFASPLGPRHALGESRCSKHRSERDSSN